MNILVSAYAFSPVLGSEYRSAWEIVNEMSKYHNLTVLFGDSDGLMGTSSSLDIHMHSKPANFRPILIKLPPSLISILKAVNHTPLALFVFPVLLRAWNKKAYLVARRLHEKTPFDAVHQLGPIGFRNPGYLWRLNCKSYWGPIGGAQYINIRLLKSKISFFAVEVLIRNLSVYIAKYSEYIAAAAKHFDSVSFATYENQEYFAKHFKRTGQIISDQGIDSQPNQPGNSSLSFENPNPRMALTVAWGGTLCSRKNVNALIDIIKQAHPVCSFFIMGKGRLAKQFINELSGFTNFTFLGQLPRDHVKSILYNSDVILITSVSEANTAILFEGMQQGCVPVAPSINGFTSVIKENIGYLADSSCYSTVVASIVGIIRLLATSPTELEAKKICLMKYKQKLTWSALAKLHLSHLA